jgi:hypothetical protein
MSNNPSVHQARILKLYSIKHLPFGDKFALAAWYEQQFEKQKGCCYYCDTDIQLLQRLIEKKLLKTRAVKGGYRGGHLEIDKQGNEYDPGTCVLACYYCNNDKSYIFSQQDYKQFIGPSKGLYFQHLARQLS